VPFRLTRNLQTFFTAFGVEGVFITTLAVAAQVRTRRMHSPVTSDMAEGASSFAAVR
jgi:transformation/transcription domain-associated protein